MNDKLDLAWAITHLELRIEELEDLLHDALTFLDDQADIVDGDDGQPAPNEAMSLAGAIRQAMGIE